MAGITLGGSRQTDKTAQDTSQQQNQNTNSSGSFTNSPTFDPKASGVIDTLGGSFGNIGQDSGSASSYLQSMLQGGNNPYAQQVVDTQNKLADQDFNNRLASVRSSGYGGGIGRDTINQGMFTSDYTNKQAAWNAKTLLDAFNQDQGNRLSAAGQLGGLDAGRLSGALDFINALRGQTGQQQQTGTGNTTSTGRTTQSGTTNKIGGSASLGTGGTLFS